VRFTEARGVPGKEREKNREGKKKEIWKRKIRVEIEKRKLW
jgi:hypothetical protein